MTNASRFTCPACGFAVFNRRLAACEKCHAPLPQDVRFTDSELTRLAAESARIDKTRADMAAEAERLEQARVRRRGDGG